MSHYLSLPQLTHALSIPDLTDSRVGTHAIQLLISLVQGALKTNLNAKLQTVRISPLVPVENNYDRLNYPENGAARDARYTRYVTERYILRTQTSSAIPDALAGLHGDIATQHTLLVPGIVYRRDCIDRLHCAEPHQLDIWHIVNHNHHTAMAIEDLQGLVSLLMNVLVPNHKWRTVPSPHPYTQQGIQIDVWWQEQWIEVGECGIAEPMILEEAGLNNHTGLAMGLGLDRLLMIRKNIPDIRLLRSRDARVRSQMNELTTYREVSSMPPMYRDLSLAVDQSTTAEELGDKVRTDAAYASSIEHLQVIDETSYDALPESARQRMGLSPAQKNILLRIVIRDLERTLSAAEGNAIRNRIYECLHEGSRQEIAKNNTDA